MLADVQGVTDQVELNLFAGGYVGTRFGTGRWKRQSFRAARPGAPTPHRALIWMTCFAHSRKTHVKDLATRLRNAQTHSPVAGGRTGPDGTALIDRPTKRFYVGDAACVVDPFAGEGLDDVF